MMTKTATATGAAATGGGDGSGVQYTGFGGAAATASSTPNGGYRARGMFIFETYGLGLVFSGLFAGFALLL
jgi:hypothetical protein